MHAACEHGVLQFLHTTLLDSHCFGDEQPDQQKLYASVLHRLLIQFLNAARYALLLFRAGLCMDACMPGMGSAQLETKSLVVSETHSSVPDLRLPHPTQPT